MNRNVIIRNGAVLMVVPLLMLLMTASVFAQSFMDDGGEGMRNGSPQGRQGMMTGGRMRNGPSQGRQGMMGNEGGGRRQNLQERHSQLMQELGLSPEQSQKLKRIREQGSGQSQALNRQLQTKRQELVQYMQGSSADESKARALNAEINSLQRQLSELRIKTWFEMRNQMSPEQLQKMRQMRESRQSQRNQRQGGEFRGREGSRSGGFGQRPGGGRMGMMGDNAPPSHAGDGQRSRSDRDW